MAQRERWLSGTVRPDGWEMTPFPQDSDHLDVYNAYRSVNGLSSTDYTGGLYSGTAVLSDGSKKLKVPTLVFVGDYEGRGETFAVLWEGFWWVHRFCGHGIQVGSVVDPSHTFVDESDSHVDVIDDHLSNKDIKEIREAIFRWIKKRGLRRNKMHQPGFVDDVKNQLDGEQETYWKLRHVDPKDESCNGYLPPDKIKDKTRLSSFEWA